MVHWSFILGQGWLLSNNFCEACQNCLHPSFVIVHKAVWMHCCFIVKAPANAIMQHKQRQRGQNQFWYVLHNWLLCSHPWPNMNEQCIYTKLKQTNYAIMHWNQFCYIYFFFGEIRSQTQVSSCNTNIANFYKTNLDMFLQNNCCPAIHGRIWMNNVPN